RRMSEMFMECPNLTSLDLTHFRTENVEDMMYMFAQCTGLTTLDLSSFVTTSLEEMGYMFSGCKNLTTVYVGEGWVMTEEMSGEDMFTDCESIKGGQGTEFTPNGIAYNYAHIDGGPNNPGYFTEKKNPELYAVLSVNESNNDRTLTFFYDINKDAYRTVMSVEPFESDANVSWRDYRGTIKTVVFDPSMENCSTITSTAYWFYGCNNLTSITGMEYLKTDNVTDMRYMFASCHMLSAVDVSGFNTENVTTMQDMFTDCSSLTNLDLSNFRTPRLTNMGNMFSLCTQLSTIHLSSFNTSNVTTMGALFSYCVSLTNVDVHNFNTENVESMSRMFGDCSSLTNLDLSSFNTSKVKDMYGMFYGCSNLTTIYIGSNWSTAYVTAGDDMFTNCTNLIGGYGTPYDANNVGVAYAHDDGGENNPGYLTDKEALAAWKERLNEIIGNLYEQVEELEELLQTKDPDHVATELWQSIEDLKEDIVSVSMAVEEAETGTDLEDCEWKIGELEERVGAIREEIENYGIEPEPYAVLSDNNTVLTFYYDTNKNAYRNAMSVGPFTGSSDRGWDSQRESITSVIFDESFANCTTLTSTADWFFYMINLTSISGLNNLKTDNVTDMSNMFMFCSSLTNLDVSGFNTAKVTNMMAMFGGCSSLVSLDVSGFKTDNVTTMEAMFSSCSLLTTLDVSHFNTEKVQFMREMFYGCSGLTSLDLSSFKTGIVKVMEIMFSNCNNLSTIYVGSNWSTTAVERGEDMFTGCARLIGGRGTQYTQEHTGVEYAHDDGGANNPGYLTDKDALAAWKDRLNEQLAIIYEQVEELEELLQTKDPNHVATELWQSIEGLKNGIVYVSEM
ncbi:MAG: BspA family leucine-rich repeat surface protein, partial [Paludibacteraceae bacterium]|nr:BspA family leucine-rich repeat surface protein [Paludibacteraceae bacterium]